MHTVQEDQLARRIHMVSMIPMTVDGQSVIGIQVALPKTNLLAITTSSGYIMCGALDIQLLNERLSQREIIAARMVGVRTLEELLNGTVESSTFKAQELGIVPGTRGYEALRLMLAAEGRIKQGS
jgi:uncharacterized protein YunC (DUF1805 family)